MQICDFLYHVEIYDFLYHIAGFSFLPYPGAAYAAQVLDGSAVPTQTILPGVAYNAVMTTAEAQAQYSQPVTSSYRAAEHSLVDKNMAVANAVPVLSAVNPVNSGQSAQPLKPPLQSINLTDLLDYSIWMDHGMAEAAGSVDLRSPAVLANMLQLQSLNAAGLPAASCSDERSTQASQPADVRQFPVAKPPIHGLQPFQEAMNINQQHVPLSNQQLAAGQLYAGYGAMASTAAVLQSSQQKDTVQGGGAVWPWGDQVLITDKSQNAGAAGVVQPPSVSTSSSLTMSYEAVSPPAASADSMSFSLLDNLQLTADAASGYQLNNFLGSTVDTSALFAAAPYNLASTSQHSRTDTWTGAAVSSASYSAAANARLPSSLELNERSSAIVPHTTLETAVSQPSVVGLEKVQKQKPNLGVVLPMTHNNPDERNSVISEASSSCRTTSVSGDTQSAGDPQNEYLANGQLSAEKSSGPAADTATGGIVLTNITGNVYVNQYTMLPGGTQPLDNALLHADLAVGGGTGSLSYDSVVGETSYSLAAPSVAVMLNTGDNELTTFAAEPLTSVGNVQQPRNLPHSAQPASRKSVAPESSFFGAEAAPVLAAKPSNKFESCFLQFICGHKAETLSSVLNSPIKTRPVLPKYIPEPPRPKAAEVNEVSMEESEDKMEVAHEPSPVTTDDNDTTAPPVTESASASNVRCLFVLQYYITCAKNRAF